MAEDLTVYLADGSEGEPTEVHINGSTTRVSIRALRGNEGGDRDRRGKGNQVRERREKATRGNGRGVFKGLARDI
jgi:hypothetical protein